MRLEALDYLCCPSCNGSLELDIQEEAENGVSSGTLDCVNCGQQYVISDGFPDLIFPKTLETSDMNAQKFYDVRSKRYDLRLRLSNIRWGRYEYIFMEKQVMKRLVKLLELRKNASVLDTGTGTGRYLPLIADHISTGGKLHGSDISPRMLEIAENKMKEKGIQAELLLANASYLPYRTSSFDAVFHNGGLNTFAKKKRAVEEMNRVAKPGGKIVICDEGISPEKQKTWLGKKIIKRDPLYGTQPPVELVPERSENLRGYFSSTGLSWIIEFNKPGK